MAKGKRRVENRGERIDYVDEVRVTAAYFREADNFLEKRG